MGFLLEMGDYLEEGGRQEGFDEFDDGGLLTFFGLKDFILRIHIL